MIWFKLGLILAALIAVGGIVHQHNVGEQEKGAAIVRAQAATAKASQEAANAQKARVAQAKAEKAAAVAVARWEGVRKDLGEAELQREASNEQLARRDAEYAEWRNRPLPRAVIDELRDAVARATGADQGHRGVSGGAGVPAGPKPAGRTGNQ